MGTRSRGEGGLPLLVVLLVLFAAPAQTQTAVVVSAVDSAGRALPGATVSAGCPGGAELRATTDLHGFAVIAGLPSCPLSLTLRSPLVPADGCRDGPRRLAEGETILLRAVVRSPGEGTAPCSFAVDRLEVRVVAREELDALPRDLPSSRSAWSLLETAEPAAILDRIDGPGLYLDQPGRLSMRGASWTQNAILLDGLDVTDPARGGAPLLEPDLEGLRSIEATSALAPVELPVPGVTLVLVPREPSRYWQGVVLVHGLTAGLQAAEPANEAPSIARFRSRIDASGLATGPVAGERLRLLLSARVARVGRLERSDPRELESRLLSVLGHVVYQPSEGDTLRLLAALQVRRRPFAGRAMFYDAVDEHADSLGAGVAWTRIASAGTWSARAGLWSGLFTTRTEGHEPGRTIERLLDGPVPELVFPGRSRRLTWTGTGGLALRGSRLGGLWHAPRFGIGVEGASSTERPGAGGPIPEAVGGLAARVWEYAWAGPDSGRRARSLVAYAADRVVLRDRLLLEGGLRLDAIRGWAGGGAAEVSWTTLSPRISARLRLTHAGGLTMLAGWGEYTHPLRLGHLAFGDPNGAHALVYRWSDANGDGRFDAAERGPLVAQVGPGAPDGTLAAIDPALQPPRTREVLLGLETSPAREWIVRLTAFDRRERDLIESVDVGVPPSSYTVRYLPDPGGDILGPQDDQLLPVYDRRPESFGLDRYWLTNPAGLSGRHQGVDLRVEKAVGSRLSVLAGATASRTEVAGANRGFRVLENDQGLIGELLDDPNADTHSSGRSFFDRAYTLKIGAAWRSRGDLRAGLVARYQDGQPFGRIVVAPDLAQGPEAIPATPRGQLGSALSGHRFTFTLTVDARLEKGFRLGPRRLALIAECFNLLATRNEVEEDPVSGPAFRDPTAMQPPRVLSFGLRLDF